MMLVIPTKDADNVDARGRMVSAAAILIGAYGVSATSFSEVIAASGAPRGSIYHHFPGGKKQLVAEAMQWTSDRVLAHQQACTAVTPTGVLDHFVGLWRHVVVSNDARSGCPVAGVVIDPYADDPELVSAVAEIFGAWATFLADQLVLTGIPRPQGIAIATTALAAMEGALILCRAQHDIAPLDTIAGQLEQLLPQAP